VAYYLAIDGGGTKTRCVLADEKKILASAMTGGCSIIRQGEPQAREALHSAIRQACGAAGMSLGQISAVCAGVTGTARTEIAVKIRKIIIELVDGPSVKIQVIPDTEIALDAGFGDGPGVIVIAGTGSIALGRDAQGRAVRAGGWGFAVSDEGSGYWIGRRAVSEALHAHDEDRVTALTSQILQAWSAAGLDEMVQIANATPPPEFARLFAVVVRAGDDGDRAARAILTDSGKKLAELPCKVLKKLCSTTVSPPPVALTGSVFRQSALVRETFQHELRKSFPSIEIREPLVDPIEGALAHARKL
jgi:glucosamine kinase